jgi:aminopeptidase N
VQKSNSLVQKSNLLVQNCNSVVQNCWLLVQRSNLLVQEKFLVVQEKFLVVQRRYLLVQRKYRLVQKHCPKRPAKLILSIIMLPKFLFLALILVMANFVSAQLPPLETGVAQVLAKWRAAHYSDVRYKLSLTLEKQAPLMQGEIEIRVNLTAAGAKNDLILDWRAGASAGDKDKPFLDVVSVNAAVIKELPDGGNFAYAIDKEHLAIAQRLLKAGENVIKIQFASPIKTSGAAITRYVDKEDGAEYVYSLFVPSDASTAIPVFDQPDLKARFQLNLVVPIAWEAVSNTTRKISDETIEVHHRVKGEEGFTTLAYNTYIFAETKPISTYVFAFATGEFAEVGECDNEKKSLACVPTLTGKEYGTGHQSFIYVRKSQAEKFKPHAAETFRLNREAVRYLETYFDFKFPFPKYDLVLIPEFPFNGMEHAGATFIREASVIFPSEPTKNDLVSRANVIFHEAAHQWFGDTVTMRWFDDLWLKEGFAEFMAYKTLEKTMPEYNAWKAFYERNKPLAYLTDSTRGTTPIYQEIANLSAAKSAYGNIVYRKAPSFLRQAEFYLGEDKFQTAVRAFLKKYQYKNAEWTDLVAEFETASGQDLKSWANVWVKQRGLPVFRLKIEKKQNFVDSISLSHPEIYLRFSQSDILGEGGLWMEKLQFLYVYEDGRRRTEAVTFQKGDKELEELWGVDLKGKATKAAQKELRPPQFIFPNYQDYGYGIFLLDDRSREYVLKNIQNEKDDFLRSMMWGALWDSVREAELNPQDYVELAIKNIAVETDELTIQTILSRVSTAMNYYLSDAQRAAIAPKLEDLLIEKLTAAKTKGQRLTYYRAFLNIASSQKAQQALKNILEANNKATKAELEAVKNASPEDEKKPGFFALPVLSNKDKFDLVTRLMILGDDDAPKFLAELEKNAADDNAKRYAYAARAGTASAESKKKFWNDFTGNKEISESWIEAAFVPFNSVRHSELTLPYLEKALAELPNLKRSRKIFFVNGWLGAFIGGQKDEKARAAVNKFLADNPNLDKDLRLKILENLDGLERAVRIRAKYGEKVRSEK